MILGSFLAITSLVFNLFPNFFFLFFRRKKALSVYVKEKNHWICLQWKKWRWKNATSAVLIGLSLHKLNKNLLCQMADLTSVNTETSDLVTDLVDKIYSDPLKHELWGFFYPSISYKNSVFKTYSDPEYLLFWGWSYKKHFLVKWQIWPKSTQKQTTE